MQNRFFFIAVILFTGFVWGQGKSESILDKISYVDTTLYTSIPETPRLCDELKLKKERINVGDCTLYVEEEGAGVPIVLINGGPGGTHHCFHPFFSEAAKFARVIYYDQRGCGLSDFTPGKDGYSVDQAVEDLDAIRKALKIDKWILLGYSYGGFLAQYYTVKHPQNISALVLLSASPGFETKGDSRQGLFITQDEEARLSKIRKDLSGLYKEKKIDKTKYIQLLIYNNYLNADWKRQSFYKPSKERAAQMALYEWVNDSNFNSILNQSAYRIDLKGAFNECPVPTLILEGKWDLTWSETKRDELKENHPGSTMILFENASHGIYEEDPVNFFASLKNFVSNLPAIDENAMIKYSAYLEAWNKEMRSKPGYMMKSVNWGIASSKKITEAYTRAWLKDISSDTGFLRLGFAFYDMDNYNEALLVFEQMEKYFSGDKQNEALSLIWQGHMLDLLGNRNEAVKRYGKAASMNLEDQCSNSQYGLNYKLSPYAKERMTVPFIKKENSQID